MKLRNFLFGRTGGYYLFWCSAIYLVVGLTCALYYKEIRTEFIQMVWISVLALPFAVPPVGRYFNLDVTWDQKMLNWFKGKTAKEYLDEAKAKSNVVPFPKQETEYGSGDGGGQIEPPKKPPVTFYTLGMTSENRVEFKMGYSAITMNYGGLVNLMDQLEVFKKQLAQYEGIVEDAE